MRAAILLVVLAFIGLSMAYVMETRLINHEQIAKIRCSLNPQDETFFFFNGSVIAYLDAQPAPGVTTTRVLFKTIGINVGRCFLRPDGTYSLASRELLYYLDPVTDKIIDQWVNPWNTSLGNLTVAHVDNDPVLQNFTVGQTVLLQVYEDKAFMNLDIPLVYPNPLYSNPATRAQFAPYSPLPLYQAGEFFKFIFPVADLDANKDTVDYSLVSWTRIGPWLPWMAMGSTPGYLLYSSSGARIPSWEHLPAGVKADLENRIPHYKHAPDCVPNTRSVTSWTFFGAKFQQWLDGAQFPLTQAAQYSCVPGTELPTNAPTSTPTDAPNNACRVVATATASSTWLSNGEAYYSYQLSFENVGTKSVKSFNVKIGNTVVDSSWNLEQDGDSLKVAVWSLLQPGNTLTGHGFQSHGEPASVSTVNVKCI